jgi:hypothetical protein
MSKEWKKNMMVMTQQISNHNREIETITKPNGKTTVEEYNN